VSLEVLPFAQSRPYAEQTQTNIDVEVSKLPAGPEERAVGLLTEHRKPITVAREVAADPNGADNDLSHTVRAMTGPAAELAEDTAPALRDRIEPAVRNKLAMWSAVHIASLTYPDREGQDHLELR